MDINPIRCRSHPEHYRTIVICLYDYIRSLIWCFIFSCFIIPDQYSGIHLEVVIYSCTDIFIVIFIY